MEEHMKTKTYRLLTMIPFVEPILRMQGNARALMCSQMMGREEIMKPIEEYIKTHPDEVITDNILNKILSASKNK
jgi:hypothetical protein